MALPAPDSAIHADHTLGPRRPPLPARPDYPADDEKIMTPTTSSAPFRIPPHLSATILLSVPVLIAFGLAGCDGGSSDGPGDDSELPANRALYFPDRLTESAPATFRVRFATTAGEFVIEAHRAWAPRGVDRFYNLARHRYFDGVRFHRVVENFMAQFGVHGEPQVQVRWTASTILDDPVTQSNTRGRVTFAKGGPNSRTTQLFINFGDNSWLDADGFAPIGEVVEGMEVVDALYAGYGELADRGGNGPIAQNIAARGNAYLDEDFPELDHIVAATLVDASEG